MKSLIAIIGSIVAPLFLSASPFNVAIDPGHTPHHYGAISARGVKEYQFNRQIAQTLLKEIKKESNITGFIINPDGKEITLKQRVAIAKAHHADLLLSLHHDSAQSRYFSKWHYQGNTLSYSDTFSGYSIFVSQKNPFFPQSYEMATLLGKALLHIGMHPTHHHAEKIKGENRKLLNPHLGIYQFDDLVVIKYPTIPALLLECGVIVNRQEELKLSSPSFREKLASAIVNALRTYHQQQPKP